MIALPGRAAAGARRAYLVTPDMALQAAASQMLRQAGFTVRTYDDGRDFLDEAPHLPPGCLVLDLDPDSAAGGLDVIVETHAADYPFRVVVLARSLQDLPGAAIAAADGPAGRAPRGPARPATPPRRGPRGMAASDSAGEASPFTRLTPREIDVLRGVIGGMTNKLIGRQFHISPRTVEVYRASLMAKTGAASVPDLVRLALLAGFEAQEPVRAVA